MKKIIIIFITIAIVAFSFILIKSKNSKKTSSPVVNKNKSKPVVLANKEYQDKAGFKFSYPGELIVTQLPGDDHTYSSLKLVSNKTKGKITLLISDSQETIKSEATQSADIKLAEIKAKKITTENSIKVLGYDADNVQYLFEVTPDKNMKFWSQSLDKMINSFTFISPEKIETPVNNNVNYSVGDNTSSAVEEEIVE